MEKPLVTVNILNFNRLHKLKYTFESIIETAGYDNYELSVTDNGSGDGSIEYLKDKFKTIDVFKRLILLPKNYGEGRGAGLGMAKAKGEILVHSCNDLKYNKKGWLQELVDVFKFFPEVICFAPVVTKDYPGAITKRENAEIKINAPGVPAFCVAIRKKDYEEIGGFKDCYNVLGPKQLRHGKWGMEPLFAKEVRDLAKKRNLGTGCGLPLKSAAMHDWIERGFRDTVYKWADERPEFIINKEEKGKVCVLEK